MVLSVLKVVNFAQTHSWRVPQIWRRRQRGTIMATPKIDRHKDYARYAEHCLNMVTAAKDQESRAIQREMAAEWLRLADAIRRPSKRAQMQMG